MLESSEYTITGKSYIYHLVRPSIFPIVSLLLVWLYLFLTICRWGRVYSVDLTSVEYIV